MSWRRLVVATAALAAVAATAMTVKCRHEQAIARQELTGLIGAVKSGASRADLRSRVGGSEHLIWHAEGVKVAVATPLAWGARNWVHWLEYHEDQLCTMRVRIYDSETIRPEDGPADVSFDCDNEGAAEPPDAADSTQKRWRSARFAGQRHLFASCS